MANTIASLAARIAVLEAASSAAVGAVVAPVAASDEAVYAGKPHFVCSLHAEHKGGKGYSEIGIAAHRAWCKGETIAL